MAEVFLALVEGPAGVKKLVVQKRAKAGLSEQEGFLEMFLDEARLAARLNHPNVVQTYEVGQEAGRYFIAMEYLDGQPFHRIRARVGPRWFPLGMQIRILIEVLGGLHYAHELADFDGTPLGVVHRDATPQNVFVTYDGQIKIVDFGIAKAKGASSQTHAGILKGKVTYMAPEQALGDRIDRRADIFAVGVMLWEAFAGERMWAGMEDLAVIGRLAQGRIPGLPGDAEREDPELARICLRALAPAPQDRYATALELAHELERWLDLRGEEVSARAVGRFVAAHFTEERAQMKALIQRALSDSGGAAAKSPRAIEIERDPTLVTLVELPARRCPPPLPRRVPPAIETAQEDVPETLRHSSVSMDAIQEPSAASRRVLRSRALATGSALLVGCALGVLVWTVGGTAPLSRVAAAPEGASAVVFTVPAPPAPPPASAGPRLAPAMDAVDLTIRVWPTTARVFLDGLPLSTGWYKGRLPKDGRVHRIRAEAPPFAPKEQIITASGDVIVNLALEARSPAAP